MNQKAVRSWIMYDWANSAFVTTMVAAVLPIFYADVAAAGLPDYLKTSYWGYTQTIGMVCVALIAPILGAIADVSGYKMIFLRLFAYLGIAASAAFVFVGEGDYLLASFLFILGTIGFSGGNTFYDSLLRDLVPENKRDMVSSKGYSYGYLGGGLLLAVNLLMIMKPGWFGLADTLQGTYLAFLSVAVWWFVFSIPIFRHVGPLIPRPEVKLSFARNVSAGASRLFSTFKRIRQYPELLKYLLAFWLFNDGINTVITMATIYGATIGIGTDHLIAALLITQFVAFPFTLLFGRIAEKFSPMKSLYFSLGVYVVIISLGYFMQTAAHFYMLAVMVGMVQGGSQAVARSIFSRLVPKRQSAEFFGFLGVSSKLSSSFGPFVFGVVGQLFHSSRIGILALLVFFIGGIAMLTTVNLNKGREQAEEADKAMAAV
jgi:Permeases of the major facilitator superfamily